MNLVLAAALVLLGAPPSEPPGVARMVRGADKALVEKALADAALADGCKAKLTAGDLAGLHCRLVVVRALAQRPIAAAADVDARAAVARDAVAAGTWVDTWVPKAPEPGLRRLKLDAHKTACDVAFAAVADLEGLQPTSPAAVRAREVVVGVPAAPGLREAACGCARRSTELAVAADAPADEQAALQGLLTRARCNVAGELKIAERKDPSKGFASGNDDVRAAAEASSPEGRLVELARGRALDLQRCTDKGLTPEGRIKDADKLTTCSCNVVKRWALPLKKDDPKTTARLPLAEGVVLPVTVEAGQLGSCGPVEAKP